MIQQTIQEVKFEDIILSKKQRQARKTNKLRHWLQFLSMLQQNHSFQKKNNIINQMHKNFILRQDFWHRESKRVLSNIQSVTTNDFQFALQSLEDGFYVNVAKLICQKLFEAYINDKVRINYVIGKIEMFIQKFSHDLVNGSYFFTILIEIYIKTKNVKKIKETYKRAIQMGFNNYDVVYSKFQKWIQINKQQNNPDAQESLQKGRNNWEETQILLQQELPKIMNSQNFYQNEMIKNNKRNIKRALLYLQDLNAARIDETKYVNILSLLSVQKQKLWYLRRLAFSQTHELVQQYLQCLQLSEAEDDEIINVYRSVINWDSNLTHEKLYIQYLIRRINKHLSKPQSQQYNDDWGNKVQLFRNEISLLISKERPAHIKQRQLIQDYYFKWIQVQTVLVKDSETVQKIFQNLLAWGSSEQIYIKYAQYMIRLNDLSKARFIYNKTCQAQNYSEAIVNEYKAFLNMYGSLEQKIKLRENIKKRNKTSKVKQICVIKQNDEKHKLLDRKIHPSINQKNLKQTTVLDNLTTLQQKSQNTIIIQGENLFKRDSPIKDKNVTKESQQIDTTNKKIHLDQQNTLFSKNLDRNWTQADIMLNLVFKESVNQIRIVQKEKSRFCYIQFESQEKAQCELKANKSSLKLAFSRPPSKSDDCTLFLSNLPTSISQKQISQLIPALYVDLIKDIRCKQRNEKKTAYIQFESEETRNQVVAQLKKSHLNYDGKDIIVLKCESDNKVKDKKYRTIFLKNLSFKCKQKDLRKYFEEKDFGQIVQIFIPKDQKSNRPKGFAYIQFSSSQMSQRALLLQKGNLFDRQFTIYKSDRAITHHSSQQPVHEQQRNTNRDNQKEKKQKQKQKKEKKVQNQKSNSFFSNIFS